MRKLLCIFVVGRLASYADEYPRVNKLLEHVREICAKTCYLLPLFSCLELGGPEISRKFLESEVWSIATSNTSAGTIVICGLENGSIKILELETGMELCCKDKTKCKFRVGFNRLGGETTG